jgi:serine/threonine-protein kinase HipA
MKHIESLTVKYHQEKVGTLSLSADGKVCTFEYDNQWLVSGFSISPLELPLKPGLFIAKATPFNGNFGIFEDSLPDGYGRYLLHKALLKEGINDFELSALDRLSIVGNGGMGALTYEPITSIQTGHEIEDFDLLQAKALEVLKEQQDSDAGLLLYNSGNSGGCRPKAIFTNEDGHWLVKFRHTYDPQDMGKQEYHYNKIAKQCHQLRHKAISQKLSLLVHFERHHSDNSLSLWQVELRLQAPYQGNLLQRIGQCQQKLDEHGIRPTHRGWQILYFII